MNKSNRIPFPTALDAAMSGYECLSYDGYKIMPERGNIYVQHKDDDRKKRLLNHDEMQLLKDKEFFVQGLDGALWESYTTSLTREV